MILNKETQRQLLQDYECANKEVQDIFYRGAENNIIRDPDYKHPAIDLRTVPLDNKSGSLKYFQRIRDACEMILMQGKVSESQLPLGIPPRAPKYLLDLITDE